MPEVKVTGWLGQVQALIDMVLDNILKLSSTFLTFLFFAITAYVAYKVFQDIGNANLRFGIIVGLFARMDLIVNSINKSRRNISDADYDDTTDG